MQLCGVHRCVWFPPPSVCVCVGGGEPVICDLLLIRRLWQMGWDGKALGRWRYVCNIQLAGWQSCSLSPAGFEEAGTPVVHCLRRDPHGRICRQLGRGLTASRSGSLPTLWVMLNVDPSPAKLQTEIAPTLPADPEAENRVKPLLNSWPTETVRYKCMLF